MNGGSRLSNGFSLLSNGFSLASLRVAVVGMQPRWRDLQELV